MGKDNPNLDVLRSFAVLLVVGGHTSHFFGIDRLGPFDLAPLGNLGVLYFFVHTSLVLMLSLERQRASQGNNRLFLPFMIRRSFRIYPLSMLAVLVVVAFGLPMGEVVPGRFVQWHADFGDVLSNLFLVQNLSSRVSILGPLWSLCYEMEMYLFLPILFFWAVVRRAWWSIPVLFITAITINRTVVFSTPNLILYVPCFLPGLIAFLLQKKIIPRIPSWFWPLFVVGLAAFYCLAPSYFYRPYVLCLVLGLAIPLFLPVGNSWLRTSSKLISKYSYGIYVSHFVCIWFAFQKLGSLPMGLKVPIFLILGTLIPVILFHAIEDPCIRFGKKVSDNFISEHPRFGWVSRMGAGTGRQNAICATVVSK